MNLTPEEQHILDGGDGEGAALAMKILVGIGRAFDAPRLIPISKAHVALSNQDADLWFAEKLSRAGARCRVIPTVNPGYSLEYFPARGMVSDEDTHLMQRTLNAYRELGAQLSFNCTPYLENNIPRQGEVVAFSESSATPYVNSVWGAYSNREAAQSALCAAVIGKVPEYGLLIPENRRATARVVVDASLDDDFAYQQLGWVTPQKIEHQIPVFEGIPKDVSMEALMNLGAQLNTAGAVSMYHIAGITPEAPTLEAALRGEPPKIEVVVTQEDLDTQIDLFSEPAGDIDFVMFGCPHHTIRQVSRTAEIVKGRTLKTEMWILTSSHTHRMTERMGLLETINNAGGRIVPDTCIDQPCWRHLYGKTGATDSPKCAYYTKRRNMRFVVRDLQTCVRAALKGKIE